MVLESFVNALCGIYLQAANKIGDLVQLMDRVEPKNPVLFDAFAKVFCRVVSNAQAVLNVSLFEWYEVRYS